MRLNKFNKILQMDDVKIMSEKKPRELFKERVQRVSDTIVLKEPDRVPITPMCHFYHAEQVGLSKKEAMYNPEKSVEAAIKVFKDSNWDQVPSPMAVFSGRLLDLLGTQFFKWPGASEETQRLADHQPYQFVENEYMKAEEYEEYFADPTGFLIRELVPRHHKNLNGLSDFPNIFTLGCGYLSMMTMPVYMAMPPAQKTITAWQEASKYFFSVIMANQNYEKTMKKMGYPVGSMSLVQAPYDVVSEFFRGMQGTMLDMYRRPEELKRLLDLQVQPAIDSIVQLAQLSGGSKTIFMPLHRGADGFMSNEQFEEFYWPTLTRVMEGLIKNGLIPSPFFEGGYNERLDYLTEFAKKHKGNLIYWFDKTDIIRGKEMFGDYACIKGNVPASLLIAGTPSQVEEYVKKHIEGCMDGGGYIVESGIAGIPDESRAENVKAMTDAVFKYGVYRK